MTNARIVRNWIKQFSDQKLAEVYAFNQDGKMSYVNPCSCILGVTLSDKLHTSFKECIHELVPGHYSMAKALPGAYEAEEAYLKLSIVACDFIARWRLSRILKAEMLQRDRARAALRTAGAGVERQESDKELTHVP